jgi:hypothetical protein
MTIFLQILSLGAILGLFVGWCAWVYETNRRIDAPEFLANIHVHGIEASRAQALAQSIAVGVVGQVAEHKRVLEFVNSASKIQSDRTEMGAYLRISQPAPALIAAPKPPSALDITVEVAGSKIETKGLQAFFAGGQTRGGLTLSMLLEEFGDGKLKGLVSASFLENPAYGFSQEVEGTAREIAEQVAMRFVQAHYAADDDFFDALAPSNFRKIWAARRNAAEIALQWAGSRDLADDSLKNSAKASYAMIADMATRYTRRPDLQRLSAYLARASEDFQSARVHLEAVMKEVPDGREKEHLQKLIAALEADEESKRAIAVAPAAPTPTRPRVPAGPTSSADAIDAREGKVLGQPHLASFGLAALAERARKSDSNKKIKVALVLGGIEPFEPFGNRIVPADPEDTPPGGDMNTHIQQMASLIATFAPKAQVQAYGAIDANGSASNDAVITAIARAAASDADIITINLGPLRGAGIRALISKAAQPGKLVLLAGGNDSARLDPKKDAVFESALMVGAWEQTQRAEYSNYGTPVAFFAPGRSLAISRDRISETRGTSIATALASAVAANVKMLANESLSGTDLASRIKAMTRKENGQMVLRYEASN